MQLLGDHVVPAIAGDLHAVQLHQQLRRLNLLTLERCVDQHRLIPLAIGDTIRQVDLARPVQGFECSLRLPVHREHSRHRVLALLAG